MNRIYRLIWNTALNCWMVASEHTKGQGKRATRTVAAVSLVMLSMPALAVEKGVDEDGYQAVQELPAAQPWLPGPYPFATGMDARAVSTLAVRNQTALVSDDSYRNATISGNNSIILGSRSSISGAHGVAYGNVVEVNGNMASAVGAYAKALANGATVFGAEAQVTMADAVAVGRGSAATAYDAVAIGFIAKASGQNSTAVGRGASSAGMASIALGSNADAPASRSIAIGGSSTVISNSADAVALGYGAKVDINGAGSLALGARSIASGGSAVAIGPRASVTTHGGVGGIAIGADAAAGVPGYSGAIAVGSSSKATFNGVALGQAAQATASSTVALGQGSVANVSGTVSVGNATTKRKIVNVADGALSSSSTDAVTGKQLYKATQDVGTAISTANTAKSTAELARADATNALSKANTLGGLLSQTAASSTMRVGAENTGSVLDVRNKSSANRVITGVGIGAVTANSSDAVSGRQLYATDEKLTATTGTANTAKSTADLARTDATNALGKANVLGGLLSQTTTTSSVRVGAENTGAVLDVRNKSNASRVITGVANGAVTASSTDAVSGRQLHATDEKLTVTTGTANTAKSTADLARADATNALGKANVLGGLLSQTATASSVRVGGENTGTVLDVRNKSNASRVITGVANGAVTASSTDAVSGRQLHATDEKLTVTTGTANTAKSTADLARADATNALGKANVLGGLLSQTATASSVRLGGENTGTVLDVRNKSNAGRVITGVADGAIGAGSKEAVTGGQLFQQQQAVSTNTQRIDANLGRINSNQTGVGTNRDAIAGNRSNIGVNGEAIAKLRSEFDAYAPELDGVVMFNDDRTRVDMEGARVTGVLDGDIRSGSKDAVTGGQLFVTNTRINDLEEQHRYFVVGSDGFSVNAQAGLIAVAIGDSAEASLSTEGATAVGSFAKAKGENSVALGRAAHVHEGASHGFALGASSQVETSNGVAVGAGSIVRSSATGSVALGYASIAEEANTVSVGHTTYKRRVVNVAAGRKDDDAVTILQLKDTLGGLGGGASIDASGTIVEPTYKIRNVDHHNVGDALAALDGAATSTNEAVKLVDSRLSRMFQEEATARTDGAGRLILGGTHGMVLGNVANGLIAAGSRDAVNGGQLYATNQQVGQNRDAISGLREELSGVGQHGARSVMGSDEPSFNFGGSRLTGVGAGDISSAESKDAVNGGQLYVTNERVNGLVEQGQFLSISADDLSEPASAGRLAIAMGSDADASGNGATALGSFAKALGENSVALGRGSYVIDGADRGFALGSNSTVSAMGGVALGSMTWVKPAAKNSVALGYGSVSAQANELSIGNDSLKRRIANVGAGIKSDDAATVGQLKGIASAFGGSVEVDTNGNPTAPSFNVQGGNYRSVGDALSALDSSVNDTDKSVGALDNRISRMFQEEATTRTDGPGRLSLGGTHGMVLGNVANGMIAAGSRDAVNGGQLYEVRKDLQGQIDGLAERGGESVAISGRMAAPAPMSAEAGGAMVANAEVPAAGPTQTPVASESSTPEPVVKAEGVNAVAVGSEGKERSVRHVAKGTADTDAVNVQQLNDVLDRANEYTDLAVEGLNKRLDGMDKRFNRMAAMSSAQSAMAMNTAGLNTYNRLGAGVGHSDGESALAVGYQRVMNERGSATFSLNGAFTNSGEKTVGVGVGIGW